MVVAILVVAVHLRIFWKVVFPLEHNGLSTFEFTFELDHLIVRFLRLAAWNESVANPGNDTTANAGTITQVINFLNHTHSNILMESVDEISN